MAAMALSPQVKQALALLQEAGYEAYLVGGCVRDFVMGCSPADTDLTTNAEPPETERVFAGFPFVETGLKHGTITVLMDGTPIEITTYRVDGEYRDHRRPDSVRFTRSLREDLARRDFTMNALAWDGKADFADPFGGIADIEKRLIRCVGDPARRFQEDALRILRALRFSSVLGFQIEAATAEAAFQNRELLREISPERVAAELRKLLCGANVRQVLMEYVEILGIPLPELLPMKGLDQKNPYHIYDALEHTAFAVEFTPPKPQLRAAALLHDIAKPRCYSLDEQGLGHFYGHGPLGADMAAGILERLKTDNFTRERVSLLIRYHDVNIEASAAAVKHWLRKLSPEVFFELLALKRADNLAHSPHCAPRRLHYDKLEALANQVLEEEACFSLKDLAINGNDLIALGMPPGKALGVLLNRLLEEVMDGRLENQAEALKAAAVLLVSTDASPAGTDYPSFPAFNPATPKQTAASASTPIGGNQLPEKS